MVNQIVEQDVIEICQRLKKILPIFSGKTLLITGGAGFLGSYILKTLVHANEKFLKRPCKIICVDNYITALRKNPILKDLVSPQLIFLEHDVIRPLRLRRKVDFIIHAAGIASPVYYRKFQIEAIEVNTFGTKYLLELARKKRVKSFLYFSSSEIYGDPPPEQIPTLETYRGNVSSIGPRACYDESKRLGEALTITYYVVHKIPVKIIRPFNIYGPGMKPQDFRVVPTFIYNGINHKPLPVHDSGKQTRTYCYISDAVVAMLKTLLTGTDGEVYNVGNDHPEITTYELAKLVCKLFPYKITIQKIPYPENYPTDVPQRRCPDLSKIKRSLQYIPQVSLKEGLQRTILWSQEIYKPTSS